MRTFLFALLLAGCGDTGQTMVSYAALGHGAPARITQGPWTITLDRAQVALGPIYFCATAAASESLCQVAVNELARTLELDALSPVDQPLGDARGTTGTIHSLMFDLGITWFPTQNEARAATALGHSAHFEGHAERAGDLKRFVADIDILPQYQGSMAVNGVRLPAPQLIADTTSRLDVSLDAAAWISTVDWNELDLLTGDPIVLPQDSRAVAALSNALIQLAPTFTWR
jgi:hypothetical protein